MKRFKINNPVYKDLLKLKLINKQDLILINNKTRVAVERTARTDPNRVGLV